MRNRECIKKPSTRIGGTFSEKDNFARISYPQTDNKRLTWFFYDNGRWVSNPNAGTTTDSEDFACILKNKNVRGPVATVSSDGNSVSFFVDEPNKVLHIFYKDKKWAQSKDGVEQYTGTWKCDEDHHFTIRSGNESYSSRMNDWQKVIIADDDFPLKFGRQGPRVVRLQKFLNDKLPNNKLTVDGIFDQATEDKLIEFQRKEGII
jgi:hypothetical protein